MTGQWAVSNMGVQGGRSVGGEGEGGTDEEERRGDGQAWAPDTHADNGLFV